MDADHLDIYGTAEAMEEAFIEFTRKIKPGGWLISKHGLKRSKDLVADHHISYHLNDSNATAHAINLQVKNGGYLFDVVMNDWLLNLRPLIRTSFWKIGPGILAISTDGRSPSITRRKNGGRGGATWSGAIGCGATLIAEPPSSTSRTRPQA